MTHCNPASEPPISRWMAGSATFTIVTSSWMTKKPRHTESSAILLFLVVSAGWAWSWRLAAGSVVLRG
jgi:hypothetical protein